MPFLILLVVILVIVALVRVSNRASAARARFLKKGLVARGLVLSVARTGTETIVNGQRCQVRSVHLDVEIPGRAPYEITSDVAFPRICEPFPGSALDLRVDGTNPRTVVVVGPAGASGWIDATAGLFPWAPRAASGGSSVAGTVILVVLCLGLALGATASFVGESSSGDPPTSPHVAPTPVAPAPTATPAAPAASHAACEAAERCCATLSRGSCSGLAKLPEASCKTLLEQEKVQAAKLHKRCG